MCHGRKSKQFSTYEAGSFEILWKICVSQYHRETIPRHDKTRRCELLVCSQDPVLLSFFLRRPSSFTPSSSLHPLFSGVIWFHHGNGKYCTQFPLKLLSCNLIRWRWRSASTLLFFPSAIITIRFFVTASAIFDARVDPSESKLYALLLVFTRMHDYTIIRLGMFMQILDDKYICFVYIYICFFTASKNYNI